MSNVGPTLAHSFHVLSKRHGKDYWCGKHPVSARWGKCWKALARELVGNTWLGLGTYRCLSWFAQPVRQECLSAGRNVNDRFWWTIWSRTSSSSFVPKKVNHLASQIFQISPQNRHHCIQLEMGVMVGCEVFDLKLISCWQHTLFCVVCDAFTLTTCATLITRDWLLLFL